MYSNEKYNLDKNVYQINLNEILKVSDIKSVKDFALQNIGSPNEPVTQKNLKVIKHDISNYENALHTLKFVE